MRLETRPAFELIFGLYALTASEPRPSRDSWVPALRTCSARLQQLVKTVGNESGELWLHLLGLAIELPAESAADFVVQLDEMKAVELRRHVLGLYVPAWRVAVGGDTLEAAIDRDAAAARRLVSDPCYYGGQARNALTRVLPLTATETKRRIVAVVRQFAKEVYAEREAPLSAQLNIEVARQEAYVDPEHPEATVERIAGGYVYEREPWQEELLLIPQLAAPPWLLLCQHRATRIICYPAIGAVDAEQELRERAARLGRALSDEKRVEILRVLAAGDASLGQLVTATGLAKSTVHHHMAVLRAAGLITVIGEARGLSYALSQAGLTTGQQLLAELSTTD